MMLRATVVITTKNRRDELRKAVQSAVEQTALPQVLVVDDGSTDGTSEMIRGEFPAVSLHRDEQSRGLIFQRNRAAEIATGDIIFSIDDDAAFSSPKVVEQTLAEFGHPRVWAVAIPFINVNKENVLLQRAPDSPEIVVNYDYIGTAHALKRELFLQVGGYRTQLFHQGEERDLCIRMLNLGYVVRLGRADPILHFESVRRDFKRMDLYGRRNDVLFGVHNVPWPYLPVHLMVTSVLGLRIGFRLGRPLNMAKGLASGWLAMLPETRQRQAVSRATYRLSRRLRSVHHLDLSELESGLPKLGDV